MCVEVATSECTCASAPTAICDAYNNDIVILCDEAGAPLYDFDCSTNAGETCSAVVCIVAPTELPTPSPCILCDDNSGKQVPIPPTCTSYTLYNTATTTLFPPMKCPEGQYFDPVVSTCVDAPPNPCTYCEGSCLDAFNCSFYHECVGDVSHSATECPDTMPSFNHKLQECFVTPTAGPTACALLTRRDFSEYTGSTTSIIQTTEVFETSTAA